MTGVDDLLLAQLLTVGGLIAATAEYRIVLARRRERTRAFERSKAEAVGLQGLVRVLLVD